MNEPGPEVSAVLAPLGAVVSVGPLVGGRGSGTVVVEHEGGGRSVVHRRPGGVGAVEQEAHATMRAHAAGVGPEVLAVAARDGLLVTRWVDGEVATASDLRDPGVLRRVGVALRRLHDAPVAHGSRVLDPVGVRLDYLADAARRGILWPPDVVAEQRRVDEVVRRLTAAPRRAPVGVHGDLVPSNVLLAGGGVILLDHEYAGVADPAFDLGGLAATAELDDTATAVLVDAYRVAGGPVASTEVDLARVLAWCQVTRHAWFVWVALGDDLGHQRAAWAAWAERARAAWAGEPGTAPG